MNHEKTNRQNGKPHIRHSQAYQDEALALADQAGVSKAASQLGLRAEASGYLKATTSSRHSLPIAENLLNFYAVLPNQKWAGDITYLHIDD